MGTQESEKLQQQAQEIRHLTEELQRTRAELRRATKVIADLSMMQAAPYADSQCQASAE